MSDDELRKIVAAGAYGVAAYHLQSAILTALVAKGILAPSEIVTLLQAAKAPLDRADLGPTDLGTLTKDILTSLETHWAGSARGH